MRFCNDVKKSEFVAYNAETGQDEPQTCPKATASGHGRGASCDGGVVTELAGFWRDPAEGSGVNENTAYYRCPQVAACTPGNCSEGHSGVLCAVCERGYAMTLGACTKCPSPAKAREAAGVLLGVLAAIVAAAVVFQKRDGSRRLKKALVSERAKSGSKSLLKIAIGFYTIVGTMDFTFGVPWPEEFAGFLRAMQLLTLDLSSLSGFFCTVSGFSFYTGLLTATLVTLAIVACICVRVVLLTRKMRQAEPHEQEKVEDEISSLKKALFYVGRDFVGQTSNLNISRCLFHAGMFLYPVLNLRIFQTFVCVTVSGRSYLRADYALECYTPLWKGYAAYCSLWIGVYTIGFPVGIRVYLKRNKTLIKAHYYDLLHPFYKKVGFLWDGKNEFCIRLSQHYLSYTTLVCQIIASSTIGGR
jgi:hypothetical protein